MANTVLIYWPEAMEIAELYREHWKTIGIEMVNRPQPLSMGSILRESGKYDIITSFMDLGGRPLNPLYRMGDACLYSIMPPWELWVRSGGKKGEEPPEEVERMIEIREEALREPKEEKRVALTLKIFKILEERLWLIGALNQPPEGNYIVVSNRTRNVPSPMAGAGEWIFSIPAQFFIKE